MNRKQKPSTTDKTHPKIFIFNWCIVHSCRVFVGGIVLGMPPIALNDTFCVTSGLALYLFIFYLKMCFLRDHITLFPHYQFILFSSFLGILARKRNSQSVTDMNSHILLCPHRKMQFLDHWGRWIMNKTLKN